MRLVNGQLSLSPTDLSQFLSCRHRAALELSVARGVRTRPVWDDPMLEALFELGNQHEREYVEALDRSGKTVVNLGDEKDPAVATARTLDAMRAGAEVIVQAALTRGRWYGRPDVLMKVERPCSLLGAWSYEPADTKLARETRAGTILQLGLYCELIEAAQGLAPEQFHVVTPGDADQIPGAHVTRSYRFNDYAAYFRLIKARFEEEIEQGHEALAAANYPEPVDHCDVCPWIIGCRDKRRADDHLSLVAGISRLQRRELEPRGIATVEALAHLGDPIPFRPARGSVETYARVRDQARLQVQSRRENRTVYELIPPPPPPLPEPIGLARLPEPSPGDVFLDLEGDPLATDGGREYLFGVVSLSDGEAGVEGERYQAWWAHDPHAERLAFEAVVDFITARQTEFPDMHVYHYAPYEPSAMKRLMGRHATREREIDQLLRGRRFVDLYAVVRQGVRAGVERYSIKNLEPLYAFTRAVSLRDASQALRIMEQALELDRLDMATPEIRAVIEGYNQDDCVSTRRLRDWLEARRNDLIDAGTAVERPPLVPGEASEQLDDRAKAVEALRERLLTGVPDDPRARSADEHARYVLAYLLDWHRREDKAGWWEYFRLRELPEEDLLEEPRAVAGLQFVEDVGREKKSVVQRFAWPEQEFDIRKSDELKTQNGKVFPSKIVAINREARTIDLLVGPSKVALKPTALFAHKQVDPAVVVDSLFALGERIAGGLDDVAGGLQPAGFLLPSCPERDLLLRAAPRLTSGPFNPPTHEAGSPVTDYAVRIATQLDRTTLAIQGPPGTGKTFTGARMICALVAAGLKVGVTATSHKVIRNLLDAVAAAVRSPGALAPGTSVRIGHKNGDDPSTVPGAGEDVHEAGGVAHFEGNDDARAAIGDGTVDVLGGTAWLWARHEFASSVDVLFVDEAGQMSLANVLGVARAASNLVLLGDPQQLEQPSKGSHPDGVGLSALQHILGKAQTMPADRGLFLPVTWRLAPSICAFTSELFYAGSLNSKPGLERQALTVLPVVGGLQPAEKFQPAARLQPAAGLFLVPVNHDGNRNASDEEADAVVAIVQRLLAPGSMWIDQHGAEHQMTPGDIRIVAPFNAHVARLREKLLVVSSELLVPPIGTVDKFQGQEAPVVIYSMATSRPEDAPRGMEFLYSLNRLNVATSRAQCAVIVVASPALFEPACATPRQMQLANGLCRYRELARATGLSD